MLCGFAQIAMLGLFDLDGVGGVGGFRFPQVARLWSRHAAVTII